MKFVAVTLLAACLVQGLNAQPQFNGIRNMFSNVASAASNAASNVASAASTAKDVVGNAASNAASNVASAASTAKDVVGNAASNAASAVSGIRDRLSDGAKNVIESASNIDIDIDQLTDITSKLSADELMETIQGAEEEIAARVNAVESTINDAISNLESSADSAIEASGLNSNVKKALEKAAAVGADVSSCAVSSVIDLGKDAASSAVGCVTDKVKTALTLAKNIANLVPRSATLAKDGVEGYRSCAQKTSTIMKRACQAIKIAPVAVDSVLLVKDAISYTTQATTLVATLKTDLTVCAGKVATSSAIQTATLAKDVVSCVHTKIAEAQAA